MSLPLRRINPRVTPLASFSEIMARDNAADVESSIAADLFWPVDEPVTPSTTTNWFLVMQ